MMMLKILGLAVVLFTTVAWSPPPMAEGKMVRMQMLQATFGKAPEKSGTTHSLQMVFFVTPQDGVSGAFTVSIRGQRTTSVGGRNYLEMTQAKLGRSPTPITTAHDPQKFFADHPALKPNQPVPETASVITVMILGVEADIEREWQTKLNVGYDGKIEESAFTFKPTQRPANEVPWGL
jgi:hypothetical protein